MMTATETKSPAMSEAHAKLREAYRWLIDVLEAEAGSACRVIDETFDYERGYQVAVLSRDSSDLRVGFTLEEPSEGFSLNEAIDLKNEWREEFLAGVRKRVRAVKGVEKH